MRKPIKLAISNNTIEPGVFGIFRPVLLLPSGISNRLGNAQLEAVLTHELSHIRNRDNLIAAIHMLVEALFWFYPVVWLLGVKLVDERERACDEAVLQSGNEPQTYADGLLKVCEFYLESPLKCVSGVIGSDLKKRIEGIMTHSIGHNLSITKKLLIMGTGVAALMIPLFIGLMNAPQSHARSQDGPKPKFEVASVKPAKREDCFQIHSSAGRHLVFADGTRFQPGRYSGCNALTRIIMDAYPIEQISQLSVKPDWMDEALFHIDAKADGPADIDQMRLMLQSLLEERFNLKIRRETKEAEVYSLVVAKGGPKLQESKDENGNPIVAPPTQEEIDKKMKANKEKILSGMTPDDPIPGRLAVMVRMSPGGTTLTFAGSAVPMEQLANFLTQQVGRTVIDKTGLTGLYDINMDFAPDTTAPGVFVTRGFPGIPGPNLNAGAAGPDAPKMPEFSGPTLFAALQEQLGLKLESDKGPVEYFIIDNIEKPSEN